ncbi:lysophospholipid acyltransferase family protein [Paraglaciecola sp. 25GB23A]|uniref:lysophospholipid acyltransferase family protein n=1 Tax=Paraglaciecola sp. 25GB23A TaxID=3156068 RepID=UPI0032AF0E02
MPVAISLINLIPDHQRNLLTRISLRIADKILGIHHLDNLYQQHQLLGLEKSQFALSLIQGLNLHLIGLEDFLAKIPKTGPLVIASNHPFGGIEGVILAWAIEQVRPDIKVMANKGLKIFPELSDYFIFTNPLLENDPINAASIRTCLKHLKKDGALLIFPASRVSYFHKDTKRIADHQWNRLVASLVNRSSANFVPVFVAGQNSPLFYRLGRLYYRLRMLMLPRELANKRDTRIEISSGYPVSSKDFKCESQLNLQAQLMRAQSYLLDPKWQSPWPQDPVTQLKPLYPTIANEVILQEVHALPSEQHLLDHKDLSVYFGYKQQMPNTVLEIARLRELVFRQHNEGSGEALDTDKFDDSYTHLFLMKRATGQIIGAYRMGQSDKLLAEGELDKLYLHRMFEFGPEFVNRQQPCLEMGRSFLIPEYQRSFQGLYLLWRGIGAFVCKFPHYRTLYGTVSISKLYDPRSVALIEKAMVTQTTTVRPRACFDYQLHPEVIDFIAQNNLRPHLTALLKGIEADGKDVPILLKHYEKLGATFHCLGIDKHFNDTPGLLLSVDLPSAPEKLLKLYLAEGWKTYLFAK